MLFSKKSISLNEFIQSIKASNQEPLKALELKEADYKDVAHSILMDNPQDIASGVVKVKIISGLSIFNIFDNGLIKYYDNEEISYQFYTQTSDGIKVNECFQVLAENLAGAIYDGVYYVNYSKDGVLSLSKGSFYGLKNGIGLTWTVCNYNITLKYLVEPKKQFALFIHKNPIKEIDRVIRQNTITDILKLNLNNILAQEELERIVSEEDGKVNFIDYKYKLQQKELDTFDLLNIRLFSQGKLFNVDVQTHVTLMCSKQTDLSDVVNVIDRIVKLYGPDNQGSTLLTPYEIEEIESGKIWNGRNWWFNETHRLWDSDSGESIAYMVFLDSNMNIRGLTLHINHYNSLIDYFTEH